MRAITSHAARIGNGINRLRERKLQRQAASSIARESSTGQEATATLKFVSELRAQLRQKWAATLAQADLRKLHNETLDYVDLSEHISVDAGEFFMNLEEDSDADRGRVLLAENESFEVACELRATVASTPLENLDHAILATPLTPDTKLHRYVDAFPASFGSFSVGDHHIHAAAIGNLRGKRWLAKWPVAIQPPISRRTLPLIHTNRNSEPSAVFTLRNDSVPASV